MNELTEPLEILRSRLRHWEGIADSVDAEDGSMYVSGCIDSYSNMITLFEQIDKEREPR